MKAQKTPSHCRIIVANNAENPCPPRPETAPTRPQHPRDPKPAAKEPPKWRNLTLDELRSCLEEAERQEAEHYETGEPH